jgi:hypothetical protein
MRRVERTAWRVVLAAVAACAMGLAPAGCRRIKRCPEGFTEQAAGDTGIWCRQPAGNTALYLMLHTRNGNDGKPGPLRMTCRFVDGRLQGPFESLHPNGKPQVKGQYRDGKKAGVWLQTDPWGGKIADGEYRDGVLVAGAPTGIASLCESVTP